MKKTPFSGLDKSAKIGIIHNPVYLHYEKTTINGFMAALCETKAHWLPVREKKGLINFVVLKSGKPDDL